MAKDKPRERVGMEPVYDLFLEVMTDKLPIHDARLKVREWWRAQTVEEQENLKKNLEAVKRKMVQVAEVLKQELETMVFEGR